MTFCPTQLQIAIMFCLLQRFILATFTSVKGMTMTEYFWIQRLMFQYYIFITMTQLLWRLQCQNVNNIFFLWNYLFSLIFFYICHTETRYLQDIRFPNCQFRYLQETSNSLGLDLGQPEIRRSAWTFLCWSPFVKCIQNLLTSKLGGW